MSRVAALTLLALLAFAGNSILCRLALKALSIDAGSFTLIRLASGALSLLVLSWLVDRQGKEPYSRKRQDPAGSWVGGASLFVYATLFSYAYVSLDTATGALILFGSVQISLISYSLVRGAKPSAIELLGLALSCFGFVYLLLPELTTPNATGLVFMLLSGCAWAIYTIQGSGSERPLKDTAYNFTRTLPFVLILFIMLLVGQLGEVILTPTGVTFALLSGVVTSGLGYAIWYSALRDLSTTTAAVSQLSVPIIAALFGLVLLGEYLTLRLMVSAAAVLGGILLVTLAKSNQIKGRRNEVPRN